MSYLYQVWISMPAKQLGSEHRVCCGLATEKEYRSLEIIHVTEAIIFTLMDSDRDNADCLQCKVATNCKLLAKCTKLRTGCHLLV